jgi:glucose-1-phosphate cytidylyltransferase
VTLVDTGIDTMTGGRVRRISPYLKSDTLFIAYGDCLSDIDFNRQLEFHYQHGGEVTVTGINQRSRFGHIEIGEGERVTQFEEKPILSDVVSAGFFVAERAFLERIDGDETSLESQPLQRVAQDGKLYCYHHRGFWACMDTYRDYEQLNGLYLRKDAPWANWKI